MTNCKIAISTDFLSAFASLPRRKQGRVMEFMNKFRRNPLSSGINYEKIHDAYDSNIYSVRIDDTYRGIVVRQERSGVFLLLWVDHHDKAYQWARRKRCQINPKTGSVQVFDVKERVVSERVESAPGRKPILDHVTDDQLLRIGVPAELLADTRELFAVEDLYERKNSYPDDAYEGLEWIANGFDPEEVIQEFYEQMDGDMEHISTDDFAVALTKSRSLKTFAVVEGEDELKEIMAAPLEKWRVFLHPTQRRIVTRHYNGPARVLGGAGTGKTVVAMHRAKWLAGQLPDNERILFTTFTANLAGDIQENLRRICTVDELKRIEVVHLDSWVTRFLRNQDYDYRIIYGDELDALWEDAIIISGNHLDLPRHFYQDEWSKVVQAQELLTMEQYIRASRIGRGTRLDRKKRMVVWEVFEQFRNLSNERQVRDVETAMYECRQLLMKHYSAPLYSSIIVDEGQDLSMSAFRLLRSMAGEERKNDLFIVGDTHQRIYKHKTTLSKCGVSIRGRSSYLRINYRTTEEIRKWAFGLLKGISFDDLDEGYDDRRVCQSLTHGAQPIVINFRTADEEFDYLCEQIRCLEGHGYALKDICVVARTGKLLDDYKARFRQAGIRTYEIKRSKVDDRNLDGIRVATMHRVKGLEFDHVFIVAANKRVIPLPSAINYEDDVSIAEGMTGEKCLLYVSLTRAKKSAHITSYGTMSEFIALG